MTEVVTFNLYGGNTLTCETTRGESSVLLNDHPIIIIDPAKCKVFAQELETLLIKYAI